MPHSVNPTDFLPRFRWGSVKLLEGGPLLWGNEYTRDELLAMPEFVVDCATFVNIMGYLAQPDFQRPLPICPGVNKTVCGHLDVFYIGLADLNVGNTKIKCVERGQWVIKLADGAYHGMTTTGPISMESTDEWLDTVRTNLQGVPRHGSTYHEIALATGGYKAHPITDVMRAKPLSRRLPIPRRRPVCGIVTNGGLRLRAPPPPPISLFSEPAPEMKKFLDAVSEIAFVLSRHSLDEQLLHNHVDAAVTAARSHRVAGGIMPRDLAECVREMIASRARAGIGGLPDLFDELSL